MWTRDFLSSLYKKQMVLIVLALAPMHTTNHHIFTLLGKLANKLYTLYMISLYSVPSHNTHTVCCSHKTIKPPQLV